MNPVLVCRVAWMDLYEGMKGDSAEGGGSYVKEHGFGHEAFNFRRARDVWRGYVQPPGKNSTLNIDRLGAKANADKVGHVDVYWVATHPITGGARVVGWYEDATV